jgi:hypothetical protein
MPLRRKGVRSRVSGRSSTDNAGATSNATGSSPGHKPLGGVDGDFSEPGENETQPAPARLVLSLDDAHILTELGHALLRLNSEEPARSSKRLQSETRHPPEDPPPRHLRQRCLREGCRMSNRYVNGRLNAMLHGGYCAQMILPGEDPVEYLELCDRLLGEWVPDGETELDAVLTIAKCIWRKDRVQKFFIAKVQMCRADREHLFFPEAGLLGEYSKRIKTASEETVEKTTRRFLSDRHARHLREKCPRKNFASHSDWVKAVDNEINSVLMPQSKPPPDVMLLSESQKLISDDGFNQEIAVEERLDVMIDRAIKRLLQIKTMKQMLHYSRNGEQTRAYKFERRKPNSSSKSIKRRASEAHTVSLGAGYRE